MIQIRQAKESEAETVCAVLREAAQWLIDRGEPLWHTNELAPESIAEAVKAGQFFVAECDENEASEVAGVMKFQLEDALFWPDLPGGEAAFVHRLAVRRRFAGGAVSSALLGWAVTRTKSLGRAYLRLDTDATRPKLREIYEKFGFVHHSDRQVGPYFVARYEYAVFSDESVSN